MLQKRNVSNLNLNSQKAPDEDLIYLWKLIACRFNKFPKEIVNYISSYILTVQCVSICKSCNVREVKYSRQIRSHRLRITAYDDKFCDLLFCSKVCSDKVSFSFDLHPYAFNKK